jgi:hypothetical protein
MAFGRDLVPVAQIDLSALHEHWDGVKCVYQVRDPHAPRP